MIYPQMTVNSSYFADQKSGASSFFNISHLYPEAQGMNHFVPISQAIDGELDQTGAAN